MVKSPIPEMEIPEVSIHQLVFQAMEMFSDRVALVDGITEKSYTYAELLRAIKCSASGLKRRGLQRKDIVAILSPNSPEYCMIFFATLACGASVSTINHAYTTYEVTKHLEDSKAKFLFTSPGTVKTGLEAAKLANIQQTTIVSGNFPGCLSVLDLQADGDYFDNVPINVKEDIATIPYSSGTTGFPKGVMITHYNVVSFLLQLSHEALMPPGAISQSGDQDVVMAFLPFFHVYGMIGIMIARFLGGAKLILLPRFQPERFLQLIEKYKVNILPVVPPVIVFMTKSPLVKKYDVSSVANVFCGAAPLAKETEDKFKDMMHISELRQGYGMTEATLACAFPLGNRPPKPASVGVPLPNVEMQIVDPNTKKVLGPHERGEIWVKGPIVMKGYLNRPDATRETLDDQGWLHTGDIGYYDEDSYFYIVDRLKELIKYKAFQVAPAELEALILNHPDVADVAVIGIPDAEAGELPKAYVTRKPGRTISEVDIKKYVADHVSSFKHLRGGVEFIDVVPKSESGKILRRELRDRLTKSKM